jgi:hypothetical protein
MTVCWTGSNYARPEDGVSFHAPSMTVVRHKLEDVLEGYGDGNGRTPCADEGFEAEVWQGRLDTTHDIDPDYCVTLNRRGGLIFRRPS